MTYLMESASEAERLLKKSDYESSKQQLLMTGLSPGMIALDAGGGAGFVTKIISEVVTNTGRAILVDQSRERIDAAQRFCSPSKNISFIEGSLEKIPLENETVDYIFCRFVFEYLASPENVFRDLLRTLKPGGKLVIGDLDNNMLSHFPISPALESRLQQTMLALEKLKIWDPYAGRKLYSLFHKFGLNHLKVHLLPHHLIYGELNSKDLDNWTAKFDQMTSLIDQGLLKLDFDFEDFRKEFLNFFKSPERFSYSPLILVEGTKL